MPARSYRTKRTKKSYRKRTYRKKPYYSSRKMGFFNAMRWSANDGVNNTHLLVAGNDLVPAGNGATTFALNNVNGSGELVSLFDNYRITRVVYRWVIARTPDWATTNANRGWSVRINWTHDFNDSTPIAQSFIYQRANQHEAFLNVDKMATRWYSLKPAALVQMYESSTSTAYQPKWKQWMDTSDNSAPHYGIKYAWDNLYAGENLRLEAKIYIQCKGIS